MKNNKKILAAVMAAIVVLAMVVVVVVSNNESTSTVNNSSVSESEISSDVNSNESKDESSESIIIGTAPDDEGDKANGNGNVIDFPDDDKSSSSEEASSSSKEETSTSNTGNSTSKEENSSATKEPTPTTKPEDSSSKEPTTTPTETPTVPDNSSSSNVVVVPPVEDDPTPTPTPTPEPTPTPTPSTPSEWNGNYDNLPSDGFDHIKVPTIDDFYDEGLSNNDGAFDFGNRPEWEDAWYDAYEDFLVANGSPVDENGKVYGAFYAIHDGFTNGYQYLYYGYSGGETNGWGDIVVYNSSMHPTIKDDSNYNGSYILETTNFIYGEMDKQVENDYRAAMTMLLSWICPNPSQVEKAIYDFHIDQVGNTILGKQVVEHGFGTWVQVGEVDVCVSLAHEENSTIVIAIREHH